MGSIDIPPFLQKKMKDRFQQQKNADVPPFLQKETEPEKKNQFGNDLKNGSSNIYSPTQSQLNVEIPTVSLEDNNSKDIFTLAQEHNALSNKTQKVLEPDANSFAMGTTTEKEIPDEKAQKQAADLKDFMVNARGADPIDVHEEIKDVPPEQLSQHKTELIQDREENNPLYQRKLANLKWTDGLNKSMISELEKGSITPDEYNTVRHNMDMLTESTGQGDYSNQRGAVKSMAQDIMLHGGENKDKLLGQFATEVGKVYGNAFNNNADKVLKDTPESKYLNNDEQLGLQYVKDVAPDKAEQYNRILVDPQTYKDNPDALRAANHLKQTLAETSIGLQQNAVDEELNNLKSIATQNNGLDPTQIDKAKQLEQKNNELAQKRNELDNKYPDRLNNKIDDAVQEILGQRISGFDYAGGKAYQAIKNTGQGIWEAVSEPFMSDASNNLRELGIMGQTMEENQIYHKTDKNKNLLDDTLVIQPELQKQIDGIKNNSVLTQPQKEQQLYKLLRENTDKFGRVPIQNGKFNISPSSIMYGLTDLGTSLLPFVGIEAATGGIGGTGTAAKFLRTFTAAAATTFHDEYSNALMEGKGQSEAYKNAMTTTAINSMAMAGAGTPTAIKEMASGMKTSAAKIIAQMSDKEIESVLSKGTPKGLKVFGQSLKERIKATPAMIGEGLKTGAKFEGYMAAANLANDREVNFKQSLLGIANFGILGAGLGHIGYKSPTELQKSGGLEFAKNPDEYISVAEKMQKDGQLSQAEFDHRKDLIERYGEAYKTLPKANAKGKPLDEKQKAEYLYNTVIKNEGNKAKSTLPPKQAEKAEMTALVADHANDLILDPKTETQLLSTQKKLESQLEKKDEEGKLELTDKDRKDAQAELQAVNDAIENNKTAAFVEEPKKVAESVPLEESKVSVEPPQNIPESIPLVNEENKTPEIQQPTEDISTAETKLPENPPPTKEGESGAFAEEKRTILSHRGLQEIATEHGLDNITSRERKTDPKLFKDAETTIDKWVNDGSYPQKVEGLVKDAENGKVLTDEERVIVQQHIANVRGELNSMDIKSPEYDIRLKELQRLVKAGEITRSAAGAALRVPFMGSTQNDLPSMMVEEMAVSKTGELTSGQKEVVQKEYTDISKAQKVYEEKIAGLEAENAKLRAAKKVAEIKSNTPKGKKAHTDFVTERKKITESISEKLKKARGELNVVPVPYAKELIAIAPDVAKLMKSYVEEGITKLEDITNKIYDDLKDHIKDLKEKDIHDIIAGEYNEKRKTKNQIAANIEDLRIQAKLANKLEALLAGEEPNNEREKIQRNAEIENLREQIKDFKKEKSDAEKEPKEKKTPDQIALQSLKTRMSNQLKQLQEDLRTGNFEKESKPQIKLDKEAQDLKNNLVKLKQDRALRLMKQDYANRSKRDKAIDMFGQILNIPRTIMSSMDYSALLRQSLFSATSHPRTAGLAQIEAFKQSISQKKFDEWFYDLKEDPRYDIMQKSGLFVADPHDPRLSAKEEAFMNNLAEKIPIAGAMIKGSERAYVGTLNKMRVDLFNRFAERFEAQGKTFENNPDFYKELANYINNSTGRGEIGFLESAAPVLNSIFFSPRLIASRINLMTMWANPRFYTKVPKEVRVMYMKDTLKFLAVGMSVLALAKLNGAQVEDDPRSSDFGKIKDGNTRYDIWGGFQPYVRVAAQVATGEKKSTISGEIKQLNGEQAFGETKSDVLGRFARGKLAPVPSLIWDFLSKRTVTGEQPTIANEAESHLLPLIYSDVKDAFKEQGIKSLFTVGIPATFGVGINTYSDNKKTTTNPVNHTKQLKKNY